VRTILASAIAPTPLGATRRFELHYVRGLSTFDSGQVVFTPEFLYLLDTGLPSIAGVRLTFNCSGLGDPAFPDFTSFRLMSIQEWTAADIIFPAVAGKLIVAVTAGTTEEKVRQALADYVTSVEALANGTYVAAVTPFHEQAVAERIQAHVPIVQSVELDRILRVIDGILWQEDRVC